MPTFDKPFFCISYFSMKHTLYLLALGATILTSCGSDKEDTPFVLAGEYQTGTTLMATNPIAMYTKSGEVKNDRVIDSFLKSSRLPISTYFSRTDVPFPSADTKPLKVIIQENGKATLVAVGPTGTDSTKAEVTRQTPEYIIVSDIDSVGGPSNPSSPPLTRCYQFRDKIETFYPVKHCRPVSYTSGTYEYFCKFRTIRVIEIKDGQLFIPQLSWFVRSGRPTDCSLVYSGEWNTFDTAILNQLVEGDTIVVQKRQVALLKK
jgi:hypothetical protein